MEFGFFNPDKLNADELLLHLQGSWECVSEPSRFILRIKDDNASVNNEHQQKINFERFSDIGWSFYLAIRIGGSILERRIVDRVSVMSFKEKFTRVFFMVISPPDAKTSKDLVIYDCTTLEFKILS